ncbi:MAG: OmpA family protein [Gemmobacter sp.]|nr:OmpA family protein [Gemmobacter sp.]
MKRILTSTTALSVALAGIAPLPMQAQTRLPLADQGIVCVTAAERPCPEGVMCLVIPEPPCDDPAEIQAAIEAEIRADAEQGIVRTEAERDAAEQAARDAAEAAEEAEAARAAEDAAAEQAAREAAEQAARDAAAADEAARAAEEAAAQEAEAAARAAEDAAAEQAAQEAAAEAEAAAAEQAARDAKAIEDAAAEQAARAAKAAEDAAADEAAARAAARAAEGETGADGTVSDTVGQEAAGEDAAARAAAEQAAAEAATAAQAAADEDAARIAAEQAAAEEDAARIAAEEAAAAEAAAAQAAADEAAATEGTAAEAGAAAPATGEATATGEVTAPVLPLTPLAEDPATAAAVEALEEILASPEAAEAPVAAAAAIDEDADDPAAVVATDITTEVTEAESRSSAEDFAPPAATAGAAATATATATADAPAARRSGLSDLEKFGLVVLGSLAVGAMLKNGNRVVSNTGDRVVLEDTSGNYTVLRDDDTLIRRPGSTVSTRAYNDGSTRSVVTRGDGSRIITVRDASGRVLRRERIEADGRRLLLLDDLAPVEPIVVSTLPRPVPVQPLTVNRDDGEVLRAALRAAQARDLGRSFSLRQIREYREVRALAPTIDVANITFRTGSAAIDVTEATKLSRLGNIMADLIAANPAEMFLIEGHTDAVGSASSNLALSDRRAESVALALTEYFRVPPENMVVQGYGEQELRIPTEAAEPLNRRAAVRLISPLLRQLAGN